MIYIYDILLNLNENLIEFFEWEDSDNIKCINKIPLYKISNKMMQDIVNKKIKLEESFLEKIKNKCIIEEDYNEDYNYLTLFTDDKIILGIVFLADGEIKDISRLLLDEEEEILLLGNRLPMINLNYKIVGNKNIFSVSLTRKELTIKKQLQEELFNLYNSNKIDKLNYYYYEYFNSINNNKEEVYNKLLKTLENNFNEKHLKLYEIIKLSYQNK